MPSSSAHVPWPWACAAKSRLGLGFFRSAAILDVSSSPTPVYSHVRAVPQVPIFKSNGIKLVIRLNKSHYDRKPFTSAGIRHVDLYYPDGSNPTDDVLQEFLRVRGHPRWFSSASTHRVFVLAPTCPC